ncbi:MAG: 2,3-bisphosphoglycerate-independent phosphoglycerate mutase [Thermoplasmatota archaeon]
MSKFPRTDKLLLMILDGWGHSEEKEYNAVYLARTPNFDTLFENYPSRFIEASGTSVGLPQGQMGNSEVGHLTMGAGRIMYQPLVRISNSIEDGSFFQNSNLIRGMEHCIENGSTLHLMGLTSPGGVHSHIDHMKGLILMALGRGVPRIRIHAITDGRDVPPKSGINDIRELLEWIGTIDPKGKVKIATVMGRFYAMDRDRRWERTKLAYDFYVTPQENRTDDILGYFEDSYNRDVTDEFIEPVQLTEGLKKPSGFVNDDDTIVFFNFRPDRARQITKAFIYPFFSGFIRPKVVKPFYVAMMDYDETVFTHVAFPEKIVKSGAGELISKKGLKQLRIAETEKYAHVTFFFNGGREEPYSGESRILVQSPKVRTYDLQPEMSAYEVTDRIISELSKKSFDLGVLNYANSDMVGHTGKLDAAIKAVEAVDTCLGKVVECGLDNSFHMIITADHGNSEKMWDFENNLPFTAHTTNPVPFIYVGKNIDNDMKLRESPAGLADVSPTILKQMGIMQPSAMNGDPMT